ncbi:PucR family transcriptional regulator [Conexibacter stalactiti]|uniref:PucR family transcriptional regulator n=1 Tax=Conexibacter stalactiti TaxID=1940611 RepID=A0ABU4HU25_9ACTN|nr:PucR family transcriptional regulator [Conexibacter stalactiti]MDW5596182.1 PucR family transcriptional regulator [Conexibacter stalactiti]MEC5036824.1 PucR family transcriptional regulator [Conexibacter stalactiti]
MTAFDDRPLPAITVRRALELPALRRGLPEVVAGAERLDRTIRWVHAGEVANIAALLTGGEMLLSTGMGIGSRAADQRRFVRALADRNAAALVIELGTVFAEPPNALVEAAAQAELPLIVLRSEIPFVAVTEAIHTELVSSQYALLRRGEQIQRELTDLMLDGEGIPAVLAALAATLHAPVFLEDPGGRLLSHALPGDGSGGDPLELWEVARRPGAPGVRATAVRMGGHHDDGRLLVAELRPPWDALAGVALDQAGAIVALALLRARQEEELAARERGNLLVNLADGRVAPSAVGRAALAAGLRRVPALLLPLAAEVRGAIAPVGADWDGALRDVQRLLADRGWEAVVGRRPSSATVLLLVALRDGGGGASGDGSVDADAAVAEQRAAAATTVAELLERVLARTVGAERVTLAAGRASVPAEAGAELRRSEESAAAAVALPPRPWHDVAALELRRLLWAGRDDAEQAALVERVLGPLVAHDRARKLVLMPTLEALLANGGRKAETARALHLNRQALYHRLTRIEQLLGVDLGDPEQLLTLHVAVLAREYGDGAG